MVAAERVTTLQYAYAPIGYIDMSMCLSIRLPPTVGNPYCGNPYCGNPYRLPPTGVVPPLPLCVQCWAERHGEVCTAALLICCSRPFSLAVEIDR